MTAHRTPASPGERPQLLASIRLARARARAALAMIGPDNPGLARLLLAAPLAAVAVGVVAAMVGIVREPIELIASIGLPLVIVGLLLVGRDRPSARFAAAIGLLVEALVTAVSGPAGLAFAVVLPPISIALVQDLLTGRALLAAFVVAGSAAAIGVTAAVLVGPAHALFPPGSIILTVVAFVAVTAFSFGLTWRATNRLSQALRAAEREIAARDAAEAERDRTSDTLTAIVNSSPLATQAFGLDRTVTIWNPASERIFGWTASELIGRPLPIAMIPEEDRPRAAERIALTLAGEVVDGDRVRRLTRDGQERWIDVYAAALRDPTGQPIGVAAQLVDVTERVHLERQLLEAQRMGALGLLASGVAHDFNNTLAAVGGLAELIVDETSEPVIRSDALAILTAIDLGRQLTGQLLTFARRSDRAPVLVDVRESLTGIAPLIRRLIGSASQVRIDPGPVPAVVRVDPGQLEQALFNLAANARDSMPDGGSLSVVVRVVRVGGPRPTDVEPTARPERLLRRTRAVVDITVSDTGHGIPADRLASIFEPFFTTKPAGHGTGLGLAMVRSFVESVEGEMSVTSEVGRGSTFTIRLPRVGRPLVSAPEGSAGTVRAT